MISIILKGGDSALKARLQWSDPKEIICFFQKHYILDIRRSSEDASVTDSNQYKTFFRVHIHFYEDHEGPNSLMFQSYRNHSIELLCKHLPGFYMVIKLDVNGLVNAFAVHHRVERKLCKFSSK